MSTHADFLQAIAADPDSDAPRLIYADWIEEQGDSARAAFIRAQCELARMRELVPREWDLRRMQELEEIERHWLTTSDDYGIKHNYPVSVRVAFLGWEHHRGVLDELKLEVGDFVQHGEQLLHELPLRHVTLMELTDRGIEALAEMKGLSKLRSLTLRGGYGLEMESFLRSPHVRNLQSLALGGMPLSSEWMRLLAHGENWSGLRELTLAHNGLSYEELDMLALSPAGGRLKKFKIIGSSWDEAYVRFYHVASAFPQLESLAVEYEENPGRLVIQQLEVEYEEEGHTVVSRFEYALASHPLTQFRENLREIELSGGPDGFQSFDPQTLKQNFPHLHTLRLHNFFPFQSYILSLFHNRGPADLQVLDLRGCRLDPPSVHELAQSPPLKRLVILGLSGKRLKKKHLEILLTSPYWSGRTGLLLSHVGISAKDLEALRQKYADQLPYVHLEEPPS